jgi:hypothetical protein
LEPAERALGGEGLGSIERQASTLNGRGKVRTADESPVVGQRGEFPLKFLFADNTSLNDSARTGDGCLILQMRESGDPLGELFPIADGPSTASGCCVQVEAN